MFRSLIVNFHPIFIIKDSNVFSGIIPTKLGLLTSLKDLRLGKYINFVNESHCFAILVYCPSH